MYSITFTFLSFQSLSCFLAINLSCQSESRSGYLTPTPTTISSSVQLIFKNQFIIVSGTDPEYSQLGAAYSVRELLIDFVKRTKIHPSRIRIASIVKARSCFTDELRKGSRASYKWVVIYHPVLSFWFV